MTHEEIDQHFGVVKFEELIAVIDGDFILYNATHPFKVVKKDGTVEYVPKTKEEVYHHANDIIKEILSRLRTKSYLGFIGNGPCFRYQIYPEYKSNRKGKPKPDHFAELKAHLTTKWQFELVTDCEVDDVVISYTHRHPNTILVSPDKDVLMTAGHHYNPMKRVFVKTSPVQAHEYFWKSMIIGDAADNIKGLAGKGKAYADRMWDKYLMKLNYRAPAMVLELYVENLGEEAGVVEFNKNYRCLKISNNYYQPYDIKHYEGPLSNNEQQFGEASV